MPTIKWRRAVKGLSVRFKDVSFEEESPACACVVKLFAIVPFVINRLRLKDDTRNSNC